MSFANYRNIETAAMFQINAQNLILLVYSLSLLLHIVDFTNLNQQFTNNHSYFMFTNVQPFQLSKLTP